jgi:hypothetical protein
LLAILSCLITVAVQPINEITPWRLRAANALTSYVAYLAQAIWPVNLSILYLFPRNGIPWPPVAASGGLLLAVTLFALFQARRRPYLLVGWLWYVGTLVPVIGLVQVGQQARADRYT